MISKEEIDSIVRKYQGIVDSKEFYFRKGQESLRKWLEVPVSAELQPRIVQLSEDYENFQIVAEGDARVRAILETLYEIISYCDVKAKDKIKYNQYEDKRVLAEAAVRMNVWVNRLVQFKFSRADVPQASVWNALQFLLDPESQTTILSENHRALISKNLLKRDYEQNQFVDHLKSYFSHFNIQTVHPSNYTYLLSTVVYEIRKEWMEEVIGLMASDRTGWQDAYISELQDFDAAVIWNSKRPSGTTKTLSYLRDIIDDGKSFNLYYSAGGYVNYVANIIDFVENQEELDAAKWSQQFSRIMYHRDKFSEHRGDNKQAAIVFLAQSLEKVSPVSVAEFEFYNGYEAPRQDNLSPLKSVPNKIAFGEPKIHEKMADKNVKEYHLNQILFGPPGTGKTFNSITHAIAVIESKPFDEVRGEKREDVKRRFDSYQREGRIVFTTFHQSMSYEDFIEGIKPETIEEEVTYSVKPGIFKTLCVEAAFSIAQAIQSVDTVKALDFSGLYDQFVDSLENTLSYKGAGAEIPTKSGGHIKVEGISPQGNILIRHIDGSRTYSISKARLTELDRGIGDLDKLSNIDASFRKVIGGSNSSAYYALLKVIRSLKPTTKPTGRVYSAEDKLAAVRALSEDDYRKSSGSPFVIIIDEINRGNISQIFGELITLIEDDKRLGRHEALEVTLPYSKDKFGVPPNVYIIGTMNTADRSVEALDAALRRRFSFREISPNPKLITTEGKSNATQGKIGEIVLADLLNVINRRIEKLLDKDHVIGHSYFMNVIDISQLKGAFQDKINPLLQEYFYGDFGKIGLVLGADFFAPTSLRLDHGSGFFAAFPDFETAELLDKNTYRLRNVNEMADPDFFSALKKLMLA